jgi:hypothetical protein
VKRKYTISKFGLKRLLTGCKRFYFGESGDPLEEEILGDLIEKLNMSSASLKKYQTSFFPG